MKKISGTLSELIEGEHTRTLEALKKYGENFSHTLSVFRLLEDFFIELNAPEDIFLRFYYSLRNFYLLAMFSIVRQHHVQYSLNLRQLIESGICAAYSIAFPDSKDFVDVDEFGIMEASKKFTDKRYRWFNKNYSKASSTITGIKGPVQFSSHANLVDTNRIYKFDTSKKPPRIEVSFFDFYDDYHIKTDLWQLANTTLAVLGLCCEVNKDYKALKLLPDFENKHAVLIKENIKIRDAFMGTKRFKKADKIAKLREGKRTI